MPSPQNSTPSQIQPDSEQTAQAQFKRCCDCKTTLPVSQFTKNRSRWDGLTATCRQCSSIAAADYRRRNHERIIARERAFAKANPVRVRATARRFYQRNADAERARRVAYSKKNKAKVRQWAAKRRARIASASVGHVDYEAIKRRDKMRCRWCGGRVPSKDLHFDHVIPISRGGAHSMQNIVVSHAACNRTKKAAVWSLF